MKRIDFENKITSYIDGELNKKELIEFKHAMRSNKDFKLLFNDVSKNDEILKNLRKVSTPSDFMIQLNKKIDDYNNVGSQTIFNQLKQFVYNIKPAPALGIASLVLIFTFSIFKVSNFTNLYYSKSNLDSDLNNYIAVNDSDSINNSLDDSLNYPVLLIGKGE